MFCAAVISEPSFACISITDEIVGILKDELPEARFVAADNILDSVQVGRERGSVGSAVKISSSGSRQTAR